MWRTKKSCFRSQSQRVESLGSIPRTTSDCQLPAAQRTPACSLMKRLRPDHSRGLTPAPPSPRPRPKAPRPGSTPPALWAQLTCGAGGSRWRRRGGTLSPGGDNPRPKHSSPSGKTRGFNTTSLVQRPKLVWAKPPSRRGCAVQAALPGRAARFALRPGSLCRPGGNNERPLLSGSWDSKKEFRSLGISSSGQIRWM